MNLYSSLKRDSTVLGKQTSYKQNFQFIVWQGFPSPIQNPFSSWNYPRQVVPKFLCRI